MISNFFNFRFLYFLLSKYEVVYLPCCLVIYQKAEYCQDSTVHSTIGETNDENYLPLLLNLSGDVAENPGPTRKAEFLHILPEKWGIPDTHLF